MRALRGGIGGNAWSRPLADGAVAGGIGAVVGGVPSTAHALVTGGDPWEATLAAGSLLLGPERRPVALAAGAVPVHLSIAVGWGLVLSVVLPRRRTALAGAAAGLAIAALDLGVVGHRFVRIRALAPGPQVADHVAFGAAVGATLAARRRRPRPGLDKRALTTALAKHLVNPPVRALLRRGVPLPGYALLETTGRKSGQPRRTPVGDGLQGSTFWIVAEHGRRAAYVRNLEADPRVRVRVRGRWRAGTARVLPDDDPRARQHLIGRRFNGAVVRLMGTDLLTVRVDLDADRARG